MERGRGWVRERVVAARVRGRVERRVEGRRRKEEENRLVVRGGMVRDLRGIVGMLRWSYAGLLKRAVVRVYKLN